MGRSLSTTGASGGAMEIEIGQLTEFVAGPDRVELDNGQVFLRANGHSELIADYPVLAGLVDGEKSLIEYGQEEGINEYTNISMSINGALTLFNGLLHCFFRRVDSDEVYVQTFDPVDQTFGFFEPTGIPYEYIGSRSMGSSYTGLRVLNGNMFLCTPQGLYRSTDGIRFERIRSFSGVVDIAFDGSRYLITRYDNENIYCVDDLDDAYSSTVWQAPTNSNPRSLQYISGRYVMVGNSGNNIWIAQGFGDTFTSSITPGTINSVSQRIWCANDVAFIACSASNYYMYLRPEDTAFKLSAGNSSYNTASQFKSLNPQWDGEYYYFGLTSYSSNYNYLLRVAADDLDAHTPTITHYGHTAVKRGSYSTLECVVVPSNGKFIVYNNNDTFYTLADSFDAVNDSGEGVSIANRGKVWRPGASIWGEAYFSNYWIKNNTHYLHSLFIASEERPGRYQLVRSSTTNWPLTGRNTNRALIHYAQGNSTVYYCNTSSQVCVSEVDPTTGLIKSGWNTGYSVEGGHIIRTQNSLVWGASGSYWRIAARDKAADISDDPDYYMLTYVSRDGKELIQTHSRDGKVKVSTDYGMTYGPEIWPQLVGRDGAVVNYSGYMYKLGGRYLAGSFAGATPFLLYEQLGVTPPAQKPVAEESETTALAGNQEVLVEGGYIYTRTLGSNSLVHPNITPPFKLPDGRLVQYFRTLTPPPPSVDFSVPSIPHSTVGMANYVRAL